jgi:hypothetical protein
MSICAATVDPCLKPVEKAEEIPDWIALSQACTGKPGGVFVIVGAERLTYRLLNLPAGFEVQRLGRNERVLHRQCLSDLEFVGHILIEALYSGQLFGLRLDFPARRA